MKKNQIGAPIPATNNCSEEKKSPDTQQHAGVSFCTNTGREA